MLSGLWYLFWVLIVRDLTNTRISVPTVGFSLAFKEAQDPAVPVQLVLERTEAAEEWL